MRRFLVVSAAQVVVLLVTGAGTSVLAQGQMPTQGACEQLWVERNTIYKDRGYCFKTDRAIRYFGNAGCRYDAESEVPLSRSEQMRVADIQREERALGCR